MFGQEYYPVEYDYDYVSLTETICDGIQKFYDLLGLDYVAGKEMYDDEKVAYIKLTKYAIDTEFQPNLFHDEWLKAMITAKGKYHNYYNKYRRWDNRLKKYKDLDKQEKEFSKLFCAMAYALKDMFWEDD